MFTMLCAWTELKCMWGSHLPTHLSTSSTFFPNKIFILSSSKQFCHHSFLELSFLYRIFFLHSVYWTKPQMVFFFKLSFNYMSFFVTNPSSMQPNHPLQYSKFTPSHHISQWQSSDSQCLFPMAHLILQLHLPLFQYKLQWRSYTITKSFTPTLTHLTIPVLPNDPVTLLPSISLSNLLYSFISRVQCKHQGILSDF